MGVSARERRTSAFIEYAWTRLDDFRVYWVCHSKTDVERVQKFTRTVHERLYGNSSDQGRVLSVIIWHTEVGLLLLELYQTMRQTLPPNRTVFPSIARVPLPPMARGKTNAAIGSNDHQDQCLPKSTNAVCATPYVNRPLEESFASKILKELQHVSQNGNSARNNLKLVTATSERDFHGVTSACGEVFRNIQSTNVCLWIDMNDISSTDNLFEVLVESGNIKLGVENWTPVYMSGEARPRAAEIRRLAASGNLPWTIFLNARETPGANSARDVLSPNGWLDNLAPNKRAPWEDDSSWMGPFLELLVELCGPPSQRISVMLLCSGTSDSSPLLKALVDNGLIKEALELTNDNIDYVDFNESDVAFKVISWTLEGANISDDEKVLSRQWFVQALVSFQRSRLPATIWDDCMRPIEGPDQFDNKREDWLNELQNLDLLRRKPGGYIWVHAGCRQRLRAFLDRPTEAPPEIIDILDKWNPTAKAAEIHCRIALWYEKLLDATKAPVAVFEAAEHLCRAAEAMVINSGNEICRAPCVIDAASALLIGNSFLIQTHGYSRGSCRRSRVHSRLLEPHTNQAVP